MGNKIEITLEGFTEEPCKYGGSPEEVEMIITKEGNVVAFQIMERVFKMPVSDTELLNALEIVIKSLKC